MKTRIAAAVSASANTPTTARFDVDDINAGSAQVRDLGGKTEEAQPVPQMGWFARCEDTEGNAFGLWQTDPAAPAPEGAGAPG